MQSPLTDAGSFLVSTLFGLYILAVMLRFLFQLLRADFYNPICKFLVRLTNPPLRPMRSVIPGWGGIDLSAIVLMIILQMLELFLISFIGGATPAFIGLFVLAIASLLKLLLYVFLFAIFIQVILSWIAPGTYNPMTSLLNTLTAPLLRPAQRLIPSLGGLDLSPLVVLILIQLILILFIRPLFAVAQGLL